MLHIPFYSFHFVKKERKPIKDYCSDIQLPDWKFYNTKGHKARLLCCLECDGMLKGIAAHANDSLFFNKMTFRKRSLYIELKTILTLSVVLSKQNTIWIYCKHVIDDGNNYHYCQKENLYLMIQGQQVKGNYFFFLKK